MSSSIFGHLEASLNARLAELTRQGETADAGTALRLAGTELPRVIAALEALLAEHRPDDQGRCPTCRTRLFGRAQAPCRAYLTAHLCLLVPEEETEHGPQQLGVTP